MELRPFPGQGEVVADQFALFRASVQAAQAATPTACAAFALERHVVALSRLLGHLVVEDGRQSWRKGSFFLVAPFTDDPTL